MNKDKFIKMLEQAKEDEYVEELCDYFADDARYSNLTDAEYEKEMQKEADKVPHYEAIIVYIGA